MATHFISTDYLAFSVTFLIKMQKKILRPFTPKNAHIEFEFFEFFEKVHTPIIIPEYVYLLKRTLDREFSQKYRILFKPN
jgi:hypothetical protein